jgi:hypothetical protein
MESGKNILSESPRVHDPGVNRIKYTWIANCGTSSKHMTRSHIRSMRRLSGSPSYVVGPLRQGSRRRSSMLVSAISKTKA